MTYPGSEMVTNSYLPNGQLNSVMGASTYLGAATYTPSRAPDVLTLGTTAWGPARGRLVARCS